MTQSARGGKGSGKAGRALALSFLLGSAAVPVPADVTVDIGGSEPTGAPFQEARRIISAPRDSETAPAEPPLSDVLAKLPASHFESEEVVRNPFWPVGFYPSLTGRKTASPPKPLRFQISPDIFRLSSTLTGSRPIAVINGKTYAVGEKLYLQVEKEYVMVKILAVLDGAVIVKIGDGAFKISLRRREGGDSIQFTDAVDLAADEPPPRPVYGPPAPSAPPGQIDPPRASISGNTDLGTGTFGLLTGGDITPRQDDSGGLLIPKLPLYVPKAIPVPPRAVSFPAAAAPVVSPASD